MYAHARTQAQHIHTHMAITPILQGHICTHISNRLEQTLAVCLVLGMS